MEFCMRPEAPGFKEDLEYILSRVVESYFMAARRFTAPEMPHVAVLDDDWFFHGTLTVYPVRVDDRYKLDFDYTGTVIKSDSYSLGLLLEQIDSQDIFVYPMTTARELQIRGLGRPMQVNGMKSLLYGSRNIIYLEDSEPHTPGAINVN